MGKVRESQRRAADAWDAEHMATVGCKLRKEIAEEFKRYAAERGTTASALIKGYIMECLSDGRGEPDERLVGDCVSECLSMIQAVIRDSGASQGDTEQDAK